MPRSREMKIDDLASGLLSWTFLGMICFLFVACALACAAAIKLFWCYLV